MVLIHRALPPPSPSKETTPIKEKEARSKLRKDHKPLSDSYAYDLYTFTFSKKPELNERFNQHLSTKKINKTVLYFIFIYNCIGLPAVIYKDIYRSTDLYDGVYGIFGHMFLFTVLFVHATFFTLYYIESLDTGKSSYIVRPFSFPFSSYRLFCTTTNLFVENHMDCQWTVVTRQASGGQSKQYFADSDHRDECLHRYQSLCLRYYHVSTVLHPIQYTYCFLYKDMSYKYSF